MKRLLFLIVLICLLQGCDKQPSLAKRYKQHFYIGAAVEPFQLDKGLESELLVKHFNSITPENVMKQAAIQPKEGIFVFEQADKLVNFAIKHGMKVRGHNLVWHYPGQVASWLFEDKSGNTASKELVLYRLKAHIHKLVGRYRGKIYAWDVVNEPLDYYQPERLGKTIWYKAIGEEYIAKAFEYAHQADPAALLFLNDKRTADPRKVEGLYRLCKKLIDAGVPIHGIGLQMHVGLKHPTLQQVEHTIVKLKKLGLQIHITEMDMTLATFKGEEFDSAPRSYLIRQGHRYKEFFELFKKHSDVITSVTFWGYHDGHTWLTNYPKPRNDWPLLFTKKFQPKPAYWSLIKG